jgi:DNA repair exonuclease SbcCD ATPase subunit
MKITSLELENVKRVKAVSINPAQNGLTVIGGKNGQGKTSVLDAIAWALGGENYRPSSPQREGSILPPKLHVVLDNGIVVDRTGKNSSLTVTDSTGKRAGQRLLDEFVEKLALDLPKFMAQNNKDKARTLLRIIGMEDEVKRLDDQEQQLYNRRHTLGQIADQKRKYALEMQSFPGVPESPVSAGELIERQQAILLRNAENQKKRDNVQLLVQQNEILVQRIDTLSSQIAALIQQKKEAEEAFKRNQQDLETAKLDASTLQDESTAELEESIRQVDEINRKVRANLDKEKAVEDADAMSRDYDAMTAQIEAVRDERAKLLQGANLPLPDLTVEQGELLYKGKAWDCMSSSEQLRVSVAIVRAINPKCNFVLIDKTEAMDMDTLSEFGQWLEQEGLQAICTRVGTDGACQIIIEDGTVVEGTDKQPAPAAAGWTKGVF